MEQVRAKNYVILKSGPWADRGAAYLDVDGAVRVKGVIYPVQGDVDVRHRVQQLDQKGWRWRIHLGDKFGSPEEN